MDQKKETIHEIDLNIICEYFSTLKRQGPGSPEITLKALNFIEGLDKKSKIVDIGCGTGGQTMELGKNTSCQIIGVDMFPDFIKLFNQNAQNQNLQNKVKGIVGDMENLQFSREEFDLIWSEGAIYNIGFERGLKEWRKFLKKDGYIAVTENTWFTEERPEEIEDFWQKVYPEIDTIPNKIAQMQNAGYIPSAMFVLPESCWIENYYSPQVLAQDAFLKKHEENEAVKEFIALERYEESLYHKYKKYYGYVFYIGKKVE